jgi:protein-tyrosine phosphatase
MTKAAYNRGIDLTPLRARQVTRQDFDEFDHIFAMDQDNLRVMQTLAQDRRTQPQLYLDLIAPGKQQEVPDPYYGGAAGFEHVLDLVERASQALIARLKDI